MNVTNHIYAADPDLKVTINNGNVSREVVIQLSTEGATSGRSTTVGVRYSIDGASFYVYGPELLVADTIVETRTNLSIVALGPGSHTIVPGYVIYYGQGTGQLLFRCLSVESGPRQG